MELDVAVLNGHFDFLLVTTLNLNPCHKTLITNQLKRALSQSGQMELRL
jgi:hypothetical protein